MTSATQRRVREADVVRVIAFAGVVAVHVVAQCNSATAVTANGGVALLHFVRHVFFVLSGFVLAYQYFGRPLELRRFYTKRLLVIGLPYVVWTIAYAGLQWWQGPRTMTFGHWSWLVGYYLLHGNAWFHMYFLVALLQVYLLYPLIAALLRKTAGHHLALLGVSAVLQVVTQIEVSHVHPEHGVLGFFATKANLLVTTYQFYVLLGAVAAVHVTEVLGLLRRHRAVIGAGFALTALATVGVYALRVHHGGRAADAADVLQPMVVPWSLACVIALGAFAVRWADRHEPGSRADRVMSIASDRSFGVYLVHPAVLFAILWSGDHWLRQHLNALPLTVLVYLGTLVGSAVLVELFSRSPLSTPLTGRPRLQRREKVDQQRIDLSGSLLLHPVPGSVDKVHSA